MSRPLGRAVGLLLLAACSRTPPSSPVATGAPPASAAARTNAPASTTHAPIPADPAIRAPAPPAPKIRPRPTPCLPDEPFAAPSALAEEASAALSAGKDDRALACAEEALRIAPRLVPALAARGSALAELGRVEEARLALARAVAIDPDDPAALLASAELYVRRMGGGRDALETGLEYAVRGARIATRPVHRDDRALTARLALLAGMAENDLGRSHLALGHLERAAAAGPVDADTAYERGVALYELCRFDEAQRAFEKALALSPDDPWALHQLGLIAERNGDGRRAETLLSKARKLAPQDFRADLAVDEKAFRAEVEAAVAALPDLERRGGEGGEGGV
jgi:Flp pilus assembly protein TadD